MKTNILKEVREISSKKIAEKQKASENNYPKIIEKIKSQAAFGQTEAEFMEHEIDQYTRRLLEADGFSVWATTKQRDYKNQFVPQSERMVSIWKVTW